MPDLNISQEDQDRLAEEMRSGISQGPLVSELANSQQTALSSTVGDTPLPVIAQGQGIGSAIDQAVNPLGASQQDLATIQQAQAQFNPAPQVQVSPVTAIGDPGQAALMPTLNQPINVGTSSGSIIGNHGVFVDPGFVGPFGALMSQQEQRQIAQQKQDEQTNLALKEQDLAKKARDKAFQFERPKLPSLKDPGFQQSLNETGTGIINSFVDQAKEVHGKDWQIALKSDTRVGREFQQAMDGVNVLARNADLMTDKFGDIQEGLKDGKTFFSEGVKKSFRDYEQMIGSFEEGDVNALANVRQVLKDVDGHIELNTFLKDSGILTNVVAKVTGGTGISGIEDFMKLRTSNKKSYDNNIKAMIQNVRKSLGGDYPYTDSDIKNALEGHFQNTSTSKTALVGKKAKKGRGISKQDINLVQGNKPIKVNFKTGKDEDGNPTFTTASFNAKISQPIPTSEKPMDAIGMQFINENGNPDVQPDVGTINPVEAQVIEYKDSEGNTRSRRVIVATTTEKEEITNVFGPTGKFKDVQRTVLIDYDSNKDRWKTELGNEFDEAFGALEVDPSGGKKKGSIAKGPNQTEGSFNIQGESFTRKELLGAGWTEEQLKQL